jgi:hypothetical protein
MPFLSHGRALIKLHLLEILRFCINEGRTMALTDLISVVVRSALVSSWDLVQLLPKVVLLLCY